MIYLSTWGIVYGMPPISRDSWAKAGRPGKPISVAVKPTFFDGGVVLAGIGTDTGIAYLKPPSEDATGIFWMAGTYADTPADFVKNEMARMQELNQVIFEGTASFNDGSVIFSGRSVKPFNELKHAIFMLVEDQLDERCCEDWTWCPVRVLNS